MSHKCPICSENFDSLELFDNHIEQHKEESILSKTPEIEPEIHTNYTKRPSIIIKKIFDDEKFEKLVKLKINDIENMGDLIHRRNFVEQVKKIYEKNPFCYIPYFIKDFLNGISSVELQSKYHIWHRADLIDIIENIFDFKEKRYLSTNYENPIEHNLKIINWDKKYSKIIDNCRFFEDELQKLIFQNALQSQILLLLMESPHGKNEIYKKCNENKEHFNLFKFMTNDLKNVFDDFFESNLEGMIDEILYELKKQNIVWRLKSDPTKLFVRFTLDEIKKYILRLLKIENTMIYSNLRSAVNEYFPGLRFIPGFGAFTAAWNELFQDKLIHTEYRSSRKNDMVFFLNSNFQEIDKTVQLLDASQIPFKGREITPETFVSELLELEKGDFDDADDQITRMAGLVLAESVKIQSPHEKIKDFDFTIDLKNYDFRPEQLEAISNLDFKINSKIIHVKVMINQILSFTKYQELKNEIPTNEQGTIITFKKISNEIKNDMINDSTIQIINEEGVKTWVSITPQIPSRVKSMCKIYFDPLSKLENKIVNVDSVFYETGIAMVHVLPEMKEYTVLARSLEEIPLHVTPLDFNRQSENYLEFLKILFVKSDEENMLQGLFHAKFEDVSSSSKSLFTLKFDHNYAHIEIDGFGQRQHFSCGCMTFAENNLKFCSHLVSSLDYIFRSFPSISETWDNNNDLKNALGRTIKNDISVILDRLGLGGEEESENDILKDFVLTKIDSIENLGY